MSLKVIGGGFKGKKLVSPRGLTVRPTAGRVREAIFNILGAAIDQTVVLDLFAGTGALGIEALSRGAGRVVFVDSSRASRDIVRQNITACGIQEQSLVLGRDATRNLSGLLPDLSVFDLVLMDPPYRSGISGKALLVLAKSGFISSGTIIIMEHGAKEATGNVPDCFYQTDRRKYGETIVSFLRYVVP
ncbi:MAG: 16S rRNA (guanine(966)-N(2))-methyltransferase RsmD [Desulfosudaceae bacterium]